MRIELQRLILSQIGDDWLLGIVCEKAGLVEYARCSLQIEEDEERIRLFEQGISNAWRYKLEDVANELWMIRNKTPRLFDLLVCRTMGSEHMREIHMVITRRKKRNSSAEREIIMDILSQIFRRDNFSRTTYPPSQADGDNEGMAATVVEGTARKQVNRKCANQTQKPVQR